MPMKSGGQGRSSSRLSSRFFAYQVHVRSTSRGTYRSQGHPCYRFPSLPVDRTRRLGHLEVHRRACYFRRTTSSRIPVAERPSHQFSVPKTGQLRNSSSPGCGPLVVRLPGHYLPRWTWNGPDLAQAAHHRPSSTVVRVRMPAACPAQLHPLAAIHRPGGPLRLTYGGHPCREDGARTTLTAEVDGETFLRSGSFPT